MKNLDEKQKRITTIAGFTAVGDLEKLKIDLYKGLDAGLSINEIKEILIQLYAYTGFPRSLSGFNVFMAVLKERELKGIKDAIGPPPTLISDEKSKYQIGEKIVAQLSGITGIPPKNETALFCPEIDVFLKEHLFADIISRDNLNLMTREMVTVAALLVLGNVQPMLQFHISAAINVGASENQISEMISLLASHLGEQVGEVGFKILKNVLAQKQA